MVTRIIHLDAGMVRDGVPALAAVPDPSCAKRSRTWPPRAVSGERRGAAAPGRGRVVPLGEHRGPERGGARRADRPCGAAAAGTLLQPLRLTGAVAAVPVTGVLCTGNAPGVEMLQMTADVGDPALRALADAGVAFLELATGHWPMLSCPAVLADVLAEAASGGGQRLTTPDAAHRPPICGRSSST